MILKSAGDNRKDEDRWVPLLNQRYNVPIK